MSLTVGQSSGTGDLGRPRRRRRAVVSGAEAEPRPLSSTQKTCNWRHRQGRARGLARKLLSSQYLLLDPSRSGARALRRGQPRPEAEADVCGDDIGTRGARLAEIYVELGRPEASRSAAQQIVPAALDSSRRARPVAGARRSGGERVACRGRRSPQHMDRGADLGAGSAASGCGWRGCIASSCLHKTGVRLSVTGAAPRTR